MSELSIYRHRPAPSGLHAKFIREARERSPYIVMRSTSGLPGHVRVARAAEPDRALWSGHRDLLPQRYRHALDPSNVLQRPASD